MYLTLCAVTKCLAMGSLPIFAKRGLKKKPAAKKRASGLGGIINTIVAVVDKRDDKLIEFTDSENDEGAKVTALNLGIFKIKKQ